MLTIGQVIMGQKQWYLKTNDKSTELYIKEIGNQKDTIVVVHGGFGAEHSYLIDAIKGLENKFTWVFYDQRGSLRSVTNDSLPTIDKHINDLEELRVALSINKMNLFCHSMGTLTGLMYLEKYPEKVQNVTLTGSVPFIVKDLNSLFSKVYQSADFLMKRKSVSDEIIKQGLDKTALSNREQSFRDKIMFSASNIWDISNWEKLVFGTPFLNQKINAATLQSIPSSWDFSSAMQNHKHKVTLIQGEKDFIDWELKFYKNNKVNSDTYKLYTIPNSGHLAWYDNPDFFRKSLEESFN